MKILLQIHHDQNLQATLLVPQNHVLPFSPCQLLANTILERTIGSVDAQSIDPYVDAMIGIVYATQSINALLSGFCRSVAKCPA